jgi:hypothetical protein
VNVREFGKYHIRLAIGGDNISEGRIGDTVHRRKADDWLGQGFPKRRRHRFFLMNMTLSVAYGTLKRTIPMRLSPGFSL